MNAPCEHLSNNLALMGFIPARIPGTTAETGGDKPRPCETLTAILIGFWFLAVQEKLVRSWRLL